jgi:hypothetical protein
METSDHVTFASAFFPVEPGEDAETNPGIYGRALARWLAAELRARGLGVEEPIAEDWGWCLTVKREPVAVRIGCASLDDSTTEWRVFAFAERGPLQWLRRSGDPAAEVRALAEYLAAIIPTVPGVRDIVWERD